MSELIVVFAACICSLVGAAFHARRLSASRTDYRELERLLGAVRRACAEFLSREIRLLLVALLAVAVALGVPLLVWKGGAQGATLAWAGAALCLGAATACGVAHLAQWASGRASALALSSLRHDGDGASGDVLRGSAISALTCDAVSLLLTAVVFASHYVYSGATGAAPGEALLEASRSLPAAALGALCAAAVLQIGGSNFHTAAGVAGAAARSRYALIARDEEQNPALVAELVGTYVGGVVSRTADAFATMVLANAGSVWVAAVVATANDRTGGSALALVSLPLVMRAVGLVAASLSLGSVRFDSRLPLASVFAAGAASHTLISATGSFGAMLWLLGEPTYSLFFGAGALGLLANAASTGILFWSERRRSAAPGDALPARGDTSVARALGLGLQHTWSPLSVVGACAGAACFLGSRSSIQGGAALALVVAVTAMLGTAGFNLCQSLFESTSENVSRIAALRRGGFEPAARSRAERLADAAIGVGHLGHTQSILASGAAAMLVALTLPLVASHGRTGDAVVGIAHPIVILGGLLGAGGLLFHIGGMLKVSSRAAAALDQNLRDRLDAAENAGAPVGSALPSYRVSLMLAQSAATESVLPLALAALLIPLGIGVLPRALYGALGSAMTAHGLMAFGAVACLTGCCAALAAQGTLHALGTVRQPASSVAGAGVSSSSAGEFIGRCIGPAALLGFKAMVISSLAAAPLLS